MKLNDLILIVYYPVCAGGKFTINSLGLSRYCTLHDYQLACWDASQSEHNQLYYQTKLEYVLQTVPDTKNNKNWTRFEMGNSHQLFKNNQFLNSAAKLITRNDQCFCIIVHDQNLLDPMLKTTTTTRVIKLTNFTQWMRTSAFKHKGTEDDIENKVAAARRFFNNATGEFNTAIQQFPSVIIARIFGFHAEVFFEVSKQEKQQIEQPVQVKF
jgi:hypothetical protein